MTHKEVFFNEQEEIEHFYSSSYCLISGQVLDMLHLKITTLAVLSSTVC